MGGVERNEGKVDKGGRVDTTHASSGVPRAPLLLCYFSQISTVIEHANNSGTSTLLYVAQPISTDA